MRMSDEINELAKAQLEVQKELRDIAKDSKGYGYNYTSLDALVKYLRPLLTSKGISFIQTPVGGDGKVGVSTLWMHESGQYIQEEFITEVATLKGMNLYQNVGSAITYYKRYQLASFVGIASDDDMDGTSGKKQSGDDAW